MDGVCDHDVVAVGMLGKEDPAVPVFDPDARVIAAADTAILGLEEGRRSEDRS